MTLGASRQQQFRLAASALISLGCCIVFLPILFCSPAKRTLWRAATALNSHDYQTAQKRAQQVLEQEPDSALAALIAGDAAAGLHQHERAIAYYQMVHEDAGYLSLRATLGLGERWLKLGDIGQAETSFKHVLDAWPDQYSANKNYAYLMQVQGRSTESVEPSMRMIRQGNFTAAEIHIVGSPENRFIYDERFLELAQSRTPNSVRPILADAKLAKLKNQTQLATEKYAAILQSNKELVEPYVQLGRIYLDSNNLEAYLRLIETIPQEANRDSGYWLNQGIYTREQGQLRIAARCLVEAISLSPHRVEPTYMLSQILVELGENELAERLGERAKRLAFIELTVPEFYDDPTPDRAYTLLKEFQDLHRYWEAAAICEFSLKYYRTTPDWVKKELKATVRQLRATYGDSSARTSLAGLSDFQKQPLPDFSELKKQNIVAKASQALIPSVRFEDQAQESGLNFTYFNGSLSSRGMEHIFETTGGGTAALDFDCDYWPDLYFTQGAAIWSGDDFVEQSDVLFRNCEGSFNDVSKVAGLADERFGQGTTSGDFNNDGFPDLYVCNLTGNKFFENNGDGTFTEITEQTQTAGDDWSLSCVIADLNGDSLPDLYVVNYLDRKSVFEQRCKRNGQPLTCAPTMFPAAQDRVYLNLGNGQFSDVTEQSGIVHPEGKGLAILAADMDHSGRLNLFVGNDTTPNFLFSNRTEVGGELRFAESGILSGLALDGSGRSQATMGIAYGNVTGSSDAELFITNFYGDANTFYMHESPGQFIDQTRQANLRESSLQTLGFGTEFLDADLNGELDLFVTNGHVDRTFATGEPDEMAPQMYYNTGNGAFELLANQKLGRYFSEKYLGRTVARLDWNRDGKDDLSVLHLYSPAALLTNQTKQTGNYLKINLRGTDSPRDAIGTQVDVKLPDRMLSQQLVGGDGYMTCNDRTLVFGLGSTENIELIEIRWPDGLIERISSPTKNTEYLIKQGTRRLFSLPTP